MAKRFSVSVEIGGKLNSSLGAAVNGALAQVARLGRLAKTVHVGVGKLANATATKVQNAGRELSAATLPMSLLAATGAKAVYDFEKAGNAVRAVTEMTREQRLEIEKLARAQKYFAPDDAMQSALELAKTGFNHEQIKGTLEGAMKLALAGDVAAQTATDIVTNVLTSMKLPMETAGQAASSMKRVGDVFAYTANKTNTDVEKLGETFKFTSNMAATAGLDVETLAAAAGKMANEGIRGSEAGVALRSALIRLVRPTKPALAALDRLGISVGEFVKQSKTADAGSIVRSLRSSGINADGAAKAIQKILDDPTAKFDVTATVAKISDALVKGLGEGGGAMDRDVLAEKITDALIGSADKIDFVGFLRKLKEKGAGPGELASIFQLQHTSRMGSLLSGSLVEAIDDVRKNAPGYNDRAVALRLEGIVGEVKRLEASWKNLLLTLGKTGVIDGVTAELERFSTSLDKIGQSGAFEKLKSWIPDWAKESPFGGNSIGDFFTKSVQEAEAIGSALSNAWRGFESGWETLKSSAQGAYNAVLNIDWRGLGTAVVNGIIAGVQALASSFVSALANMAAAGAARVKGAFSGNAAASAGAALSDGAPTVAGARARGGPVLGGMPYLVGERGPEIFVPSGSGRIETNGALQRLASQGGGGSRAGHQFNVTIQGGGGDPNMIARRVREELHRLVREMESDQRGLLSD
jgi:Phage-related minor tail protein